MYRRQRARDSICRTPGRLEEVEADLAGLEVHVWVADGCTEEDCGR